MCIYDIKEVFCIGIVLLVGLGVGEWSIEGDVFVDFLYNCGIWGKCCVVFVKVCFGDCDGVGGVVGVCCGGVDWIGGEIGLWEIGGVSVGVKGLIVVMEWCIVHVVVCVVW